MAFPGRNPGEMELEFRLTIFPARQGTPPTIPAHGLPWERTGYILYYQFQYTHICMKDRAESAVVLSFVYESPEITLKFVIL